MARLSVEEILVEQNIQEMHTPEVQVDVEEVCEVAVISSAEQTNALLEENEQSIDVIEAMESMVEIIRNKLAQEGFVSSTEVSLMKLVSSVAVAGSGMSSSEVFPSLESSDISIAIEGVGDRIKAIFNRIVQGFSNIIRSIKNFIGKIILAFRSYQGRIKKVREKFMKLKKEGLETAEELELKFRQVYITNAKGDRCTTIDQLVTNAVNSGNLLTSVIKIVGSHATVVEREYGLFNTLKDAVTSEAAGIQYFNDCEKFTSNLIKGLKLHKDRTVSKTEIWKSNALIGGYGIDIRCPSMSDFDKKSVGDLKRAGVKFSVNVDNENAPKNTNRDKLSFKNVKISSFLKMLDSFDKIITECVKEFSKIEHIYDSASARIDQMMNSSPYAALLDQGLAAIFFPYKMMKKNNEMIFGSIYLANDFAVFAVGEAIWVANEAANKRVWK